MWAVIAWENKIQIIDSMNESAMSLNLLFGFLESDKDSNRVSLYLPPHRFDNPREDPRFDLLQSSQQCASFPPIIWKLHDIGSSMLAIGVSFPSHWIEIPVKLLCATICAESLHNWT